MAWAHPSASDEFRDSLLRHLFEKLNKCCRSKLFDQKVSASFVCAASPKCTAGRVTSSPRSPSFLSHFRTSNSQIPTTRLSNNRPMQGRLGHGAMGHGPRTMDHGPQLLIQVLRWFPCFRQVYEHFSGCMAALKADKEFEEAIRTWSVNFVMTNMKMERELASTRRS